MLVEYGGTGTREHFSTTTNRLKMKPRLNLDEDSANYVETTIVFDERSRKARQRHHKHIQVVPYRVPYTEIVYYINYTLH